MDNSRMNIEGYVQLYCDEKRKILENYPVDEVVRGVELVFECYDRGNTIFAMANGGNAGTVDHLFCDFKHHPFVSEDKSRPLPEGTKRLSFVNLCGSASEITGLVNDFGAEKMYVGALAPLLRDGDLVMGFSGSGNSGNVVSALQYAKENGGKTLAITTRSGGKCKEIADVCIVIPGDSSFPGQTGKNNNNFHFEDAVLTIGGIMVGLLKKKVSQSLT